MRFKTLAQWLAWQEDLHPTAIDLKLERVAEVLQRLQLHTPPFTVITVAGTNGKGSSVAMLEAILLAAGYRVGAYTSPHLVRYNERIRINGDEAGDQAICESFERIDQARGDISLTYFEFGTLAAIDLFVSAQLEIIILEVGLGGRLDAVNILDADIALVTPIDIDHAKWLGDTRERIALEKAGILRTGRVAVCTDPDPPASLVQRAQDLDVRLSCLGKDFTPQIAGKVWHWHGPDNHYHNLPLPSLLGDFQVDNAAGVIMVLQHLKRTFPVSQEAIAAGLQQIHLAGRFQVLAQSPQIIIDVAHNPHSALSLVANLKQHPCNGQTYGVFAMLGDKDLQSVVNILRPVMDYWYIAPLSNPRAAPVEALQALLQDANIHNFENVLQAFSVAREAAAPQDRIVVSGSFYTAAAILEAWVELPVR